MMFETLTPKHSFESLKFPKEIDATFTSLLEDFQFQAELEAESLRARRKILLHGPSGCGKTSIAHALAQRLGLKLVSVSCARVVASHLGEASKNAEEIFKFANNNKVVLLVDEFDSIASRRSTGGDSAASETNRMMNTILLGLESCRPLGLVVACTNLRENLDVAVLRRFDLDLEIPSPSQKILRAIAESVVRGRFGISIEEILREASTPATITRLANDMLRAAVIERAKSAKKEQLQLAFEKRDELRGKSGRREKSQTAEATA